MTERAEQIESLELEINELEIEVDDLMADLSVAKSTDGYSISFRIRELEKVLEEKKKELLDLGEICERCDGEGEILDRGRINSRTISPPYCSCPDCDGEGVI